MSLQEIQTRIGAVRNIGQITKAMEVVATTKMRKAQEVALRSRAYALTALSLLEKLTKNSPVRHKLTNPADGEKPTLVALVVSDRGLAGSFNAQVFRAAEKFFASESELTGGASYEMCVIGKKGFPYAARKGFTVRSSFVHVGDYAAVEEIRPIARAMMDGFVEGKWGRVIAISTNFRTTLLQETLTRQILPLDVELIRRTVRDIIPEHGRYSDIDAGSIRSNEPMETEYVYEPGPRECIDALLPHLVEMQLYHLILEANASEHSARRVAMKTASDNADGLSKTLRLEYNKARQAAITKELIEITSAQNALS